LQLTAAVRTGLSFAAGGAVDMVYLAGRVLSRGRKMSKSINSVAHKHGDVEAVHFDGKTGEMLGRTMVGTNKG
jgi:hypothetical protein